MVEPIKLSDDEIVEEVSKILKAIYGATVCKKIGKGSFGIIILFNRFDKELVICKVIYRQDKKYNGIDK